jgi:hypothetical protein
VKRLEPEETSSRKMTMYELIESAAMMLVGAMPEDSGMRIATEVTFDEGI